MNANQSYLLALDKPGAFCFVLVVDWTVRQEARGLGQPEKKKAEGKWEKCCEYFAEAQLGDTNSSCFSMLIGDSI